MSSSASSIPTLTRIKSSVTPSARRVSGGTLAYAVAAGRIVLDLSMGTMTDEGAQVLLDNAARFAHLEGLNLDENSRINQPRMQQQSSD